jgi:hypothetical protein
LTPTLKVKRDIHTVHDAEKGGWRGKTGVGKKDTGEKEEENLRWNSVECKQTETRDMKLFVIYSKENHGGCSF